MMRAMTLRAVLACAVVLAIGCRKKQPEDAVAIEPAKPVPQTPAMPERGDAQPRDRCGAAMNRVFAMGRIPDQKPFEHLATILAEACRGDGWSDELITCFERANDATALQTCKPTAAQQESLRARLASITGADAGVSIAGAPSSVAAPESSPASALEARVRGYAKLLAIDVSIFQSIASFPGAPKGTTFATGDYGWWRNGWMSLAAMQQEIDAVLASTSATPGIAADAAVQPYAAKLAGWMPRLVALAAYYDTKRFVDDEFDRGRKEADDVRRTAAELAKLRAPMRGAVFGAWRDLVVEYPDTPRAIAAHAWISCMSVADRVMETAKPEAIAKAISECRRSIPRLAGSASTAGFDADVRTAASELGDWVARGHSPWVTNVSGALGKLTLRYVDLWPKLPATPAEKSAP